MGKFFASATGRYLVFLVVIGAVLALVRGMFAEKTGWAYFALAVIGLIPVALFLTTRRVDHLFGVAVIALLMGGVFVVDRYQESDREQVLRKSDELLRAVERADYATFERHVAKDFQWQGLDKTGVVRRARQSLRPGDSRTCGMSAGKVKGDNGAGKLVVEGNLSATGQFGSENGTFLGTIELTYTRQPDGQYQVSGARVAWHNGQEVGIPR